MKIIKSQDGETIVNAEHIFYIEILDELDENDEETGDYEIVVYFDLNVPGHDDEAHYRIANYHSREESLRNLDRLASFLSSGNPSGLHEML